MAVGAAAGEEEAALVTWRRVSAERARDTTIDADAIACARDATAIDSLHARRCDALSSRPVPAVLGWWTEPYQAAPVGALRLPLCRLNATSRLGKAARPSRTRCVVASGGKRVAWSEIRIDEAAVSSE